MSVPYYMPPAVAPNPTDPLYRGSEECRQIVRQIQNTHNAYKMAYQEQYYSQPYGFDGGASLASTVRVPQPMLLSYPQLSPAYPQMPGLIYPNLPTAGAAMPIPQQYLPRSEPKQSYASQLKVIADRIAESDASSQANSRRANPGLVPANGYVADPRYNRTNVQGQGNSASGSQYAASSGGLPATLSEIGLEHNDVAEATNRPQAVIPQSGSVSERAIVTNVVSIKPPNQNGAINNMQAPPNPQGFIANANPNPQSTQQTFGVIQPLVGFPQAVVNPILPPTTLLEQQSFAQALAKDPKFQLYLMNTLNPGGQYISDVRETMRGKAPTEDEIAKVSLPEEQKKRRLSDSNDSQSAAKILCYDFYPQPASGNLNYLYLGANGTCVPAKFYVKIPWESPHKAIKVLMEFLFDESSFSMNTQENPLEGKILDDIVSLMSRKCNMSQESVKKMLLKFCFHKARKHSDNKPK